MQMFHVDVYAKMLTGTHARVLQMSNFPSIYLSVYIWPLDLTLYFRVPGRVSKVVAGAFGAERACTGRLQPLVERMSSGSHHYFGN